MMRYFDSQNHLENLCCRSPFLTTHFDARWSVRPHCTNLLLAERALRVNTGASPIYRLGARGRHYSQLRLVLFSQSPSVSWCGWRCTNILPLRCGDCHPLWTTRRSLSYSRSPVIPLVMAGRYPTRSKTSLAAHILKVNMTNRTIQLTLAPHISIRILL